VVDGKHEFVERYTSTPYWKNPPAVPKSARVQELKTNLRTWHTDFHASAQKSNGSRTTREAARWTGPT